jgi:RNA polymerase sigma factor (sigma-70 family)
MPDADEKAEGRAKSRHVVVEMSEELVALRRRLCLALGVEMGDEAEELGDWAGLSRSSRDLHAQCLALRSKLVGIISGWLFRHTSRERTSRDTNAYRSCCGWAAVRAVDRWRPEKGANLFTYARLWLRGAMRDERHLMRGGHIWVEFEPVDGLDFAASFIDPRSSDSAARDREESEAARDKVQGALGILQSRERAIIERRLAGRTLRQIGRELGISKERVRQLEKTSHVRLRAYLTRKAEE